MSTIDPALLSSLLQYPDTVAANIQENYLLVASACLYYYDYVLMLPDEVRLIWRTPRNLSTSFYLSIRYGFFVQITLTLMCIIQSAGDAGLRLTADGCVRLQGFIVVLNVLNFAIISAFVATRLFAVYGRNWYLGVCLFILGTLSPSSITQATVFAFPMVVAPWPLARCLSIASESSPWTELALRYGPIAFSVNNVVYEILCLGLTIAKTFGLYKEQRRLRISTTLSSLFLRNGVLSILAVLNIVAALDTSDLPGFWSTDTDIARVIVPILTTRFIVHLRGLSEDDIHIVPSDFDSTAIEFADIPRNPFLESCGEGVRLRDRMSGGMKRGIDRTVVDTGSVVGESGSLVGAVDSQPGEERC
ncbi:hypothetical protein V8D89_007139 [Ganoderma adspersum]